MSHTYASVEDFRRFMIDGGDASWTGSDPLILTILEGASRRVDGFTMRSEFGSGFGPRIGTNTYDATRDGILELRDDLLAIGTATAHDAYNDTGRVIADGTDFLKRPSGLGPFTYLERVTTGSNAFGAAQGGNVIAGTWGYSNETAPLGTAALAGTATTTAVMTGGTAYAGMTLLVGAEQVYVTASGGTATVVRGVNGTTAAAGTAAAAVYRYPREVVSATLQIAQRRFRSAQSGLQGDFGGGGLPIVGHRDTEFSILRGTVGHLKRWSAG